MRDMHFIAMRILSLFCCSLLLACPILAADEASTSEESASSSVLRYERDKGLVVEPRNGSSSFWLGLRLQLRYSNLPGSPVDPGALPEQREDDFTLNRGRIKAGGYLFHPALDVYSEYDFSKEYLLDLRATIKLCDQLLVRVGQWKTEYNRERIDSSGKQQFSDRSIANYWFTMDRQLAVELQGRFGAEEWHDMSYWLAYVSGEGRGGDWDGGDGIGVLHLQWNAMGGLGAFSQSDINRQKSPLLAIGFGGVYGRSRYTRFSSSGGTHIPGYESGEQNQYQLTQLMQDSHFRMNGFSWQQELHWKQIEDSHENSTRRLVGGYAQAGYFLHEAWSAFPEPLELAFRYGVVDPDTSGRSDLQQEYTLGANWFFNGHRNKLTADTSYLDLDDPVNAASEWRVRLQWDLSL